MDGRTMDARTDDIELRRHSTESGRVHEALVAGDTSAPPAAAGSGRAAARPSHAAVSYDIDDREFVTVDDGRITTQDIAAATARTNSGLHRDGAAASGIEGFDRDFDRVDPVFERHPSGLAARMARRLAARSAAEGRAAEGRAAESPMRETSAQEAVRQGRVPAPVSAHLWNCAQDLVRRAVVPPAGRQSRSRSRVMRTVCGVALLIAVGLGVGLGGARAFDGNRTTTAELAPAVSVDLFPRGVSPLQNSSTIRPDVLQPPTAQLTAVEAFRSGAQALLAGDTKSGVRALEYAASSGHPIAQWKLGRMYADGDGVKRDELRAFEYFREVADAHADEAPGTPRARFVSNSFVQLGTYFLDGIPKSSVKADPDRAREMFTYAASYFGDADAQYHLGRMYLEGTGGVKDSRLAARWLQLAANKGQYQAQAVLGAMLFKGESLPRQGARGLMWLTLARDAASPQETWITDLQSAAFKQATDDERATALTYIERWIRGGRRE